MTDQTPPSEERPDKIDIATELLDRGTMFLHLDPRVEGAVVPHWYRAEPQLVLQVGYDMPVPIPDLLVDDEGVVATLSFNRSPFTCTVPWAAVFAMAGDDGCGMVWPESMPGEIRAEIEREAGRRAPAEPQDDEDEENVSNVVALVDKRPAMTASSDRRPSRRPSRNGARGARELPPYLKVIK